MRLRKVLPKLVPAVGAVLLFGAAAAAAGAPPGAHYPWAQPWGSSPAPAHTQPPASVPTAPAASTRFVLPQSSYRWTQPWGWSPVTAHAQPAPGVIP